MKYFDGQPLNLNDRVQLWKNKFGIVVFIIAEGLYSDEYLKVDWEFLGKGLLIKMDDGQLIHYPEIDEDLTLIISQ
jgi:hypothetical protein